MKTFKQHLVEAEPVKGVIPAPIHFKHIPRPIERGIIPAPIHFKYIPRPDDSIKLKESYDGPEGDAPASPEVPPSSTSKPTRGLEAWAKNDLNNLSLNRTLPPGTTKLNDMQYIYHEGEVAKTCRAKAPADYEMKPDERDAIYRYTGAGSRPENASGMNRHLLAGQKAHSNAERISAVINRHPIQHDLEVYSGLGFDPDNHVDDKGRMYSPAFISTTHSKYHASSFADKHHTYTESSGVRHIMHLHLKKGDPATHISGMSEMTWEHETLVNKGVRLQKTHHEDLSGPNHNPDVTYRIHHMHIIKE